MRDMKLVRRYLSLLAEHFLCCNAVSLGSCCTLTDRAHEALHGPDEEPLPSYVRSQAGMLEGS